MRTRALLLLAGVGAAAWWRSRQAPAASPPATPPSATPDPDDVIHLLREGWAHIAAAAGALADLPVTSKAEQVDTRRAAADVVTSAVRLDAAAEEVVWPVARVHGAHRAGLFDEADERGVQLRSTLRRLDEARPGDPIWSTAVADAAAAVRDHAAWVAAAILPQLDALDPGRRVELGRRLEQARASAPTRPHLATPGAHPRADKLRAGVDRLVDGAGDRRS